MTDPASLRVLVVAAESRASNNRLWHAAREFIDDLLLVGPEQDLPVDRPEYQVGLPTEHVLKNELTFRRLVGVREQIKAFQPDIVHVNNEPWGISPMGISRYHDGVIAHGAENQFFFDGAIPAVRLGLTWAMARRFAGYASWNEAGADAVRQLHPGLPTLVMPAAIPPADFAPNSWQRTEGTMRILLVGRLIPLKGFDRVIEAVASLPNSQDFEILVAGEGEMSNEWQALAQARGVRYEALGAVGLGRLAELIRTSSVLVQPSQWTRAANEQFGRSVAEAMTMGLPCLVSNCGELPNVVGDPWCVFDEKDTSALVHKLDELRRAPERLDEMSARQHQWARRWSPEVAGRTVADFWARANDYKLDKRQRPLQRAARGMAQWAAPATTRRIP